mmetsp:Transcript_7121/g.26048  ORF Transcript_7121/g.26048 Transcript_7121/m.26048 type:complete len:212 (+) Transcript_7121:506-1141(+)
MRSSSFSKCAPRRCASARSASVMSRSVNFFVFPSSLARNRASNSSRSRKSSSISRCLFVSSSSSSTSSPLSPSSSLQRTAVNARRRVSFASSSSELDASSIRFLRTLRFDDDAVFSRFVSRLLSLSESSSLPSSSSSSIKSYDALRLANAAASASSSRNARPLTLAPALAPRERASDAFECACDAARTAVESSRANVAVESFAGHPESINA